MHPTKSQISMCIRTVNLHSLVRVFVARKKNLSKMRPVKVLITHAHVDLNFHWLFMSEGIFSEDAAHTYTISFEISSVLRTNHVNCVVQRPHRSEFDFFDFAVFYGQVNTVQVISSRSVWLTFSDFVLDRLSSKQWTSIFCAHFCQQLTPVLL